MPQRGGTGVHGRLRRDLHRRGQDHVHDHPAAAVRGEGHTAVRAGPQVRGVVRSQIFALFCIIVWHS